MIKSACALASWLGRLKTPGVVSLGPHSRVGVFGLLFSVSLAAVAQSDPSAWKFLADEEAVQIYFAPKTVVVDFDNRLVWELWNFKSPKDSMYSATGRIEIDCKRKRERALIYWGYNEPMGKGRGVNLTTDVGSWAPLASNSVKLKTYCAIK